MNRLSPGAVHTGKNLAEAKRAQFEAMKECEQIVCNGERSVIETMSITAERLDRIEVHLNKICILLFGSEPMCEGIQGSHEPSIVSLAGQAFGSSVDIERACEEIIYRLRGNN